MRRVVLVLLAALGVAAALGVTASSTMRQATGAGMTGTVLGVPVALCLVIVLEVVNVAGTWTWLSEATRAAKIEAAVFVGLASVVTGTCGAQTYGPIGLVAPVGVLVAVRLLDRLLAPVPPGRTAPLAPSAAQGAEQASPRRPPGEVEPPDEEDDSPTRATDKQITAWIAAQTATRGRPPGRDAIKGAFSVGTKRAERLLAAQPDTTQPDTTQPDTTQLAITNGAHR